MNTAIATSSKSPIKIEPKPEEHPTNSPIVEKCRGGPNCPFCKNIEDWDSNHQKELQQRSQPQVQMPQSQCPQTLNYQKPQKSSSKTVYVSNWYPSQLKLCKPMGRGNAEAQYQVQSRLFSDSELDSESDKGEEYKYGT